MMKPLNATRTAVALLLLVITGLGCRKNTPPPVPLQVNEFASTFNPAFARAKTETKHLAAQIVAAVQAQDYSTAFAQLQILTAAPNPQQIKPESNHETHNYSRQTSLRPQRSRA